jgi:hypothetical protein
VADTSLQEGRQGVRGAEKEEVGARGNIVSPGVDAVSVENSAKVRTSK